MIDIYRNIYRKHIMNNILMISLYGIEFFSKIFFENDGGIIFKDIELKIIISFSRLDFGLLIFE